MQQLLLSWVLVGILELPATEVGLLQALIGIPGIFLMLMGGASADSGDPRRLLIIVYLVGPIFPLLLAYLSSEYGLAVWNVLLWALGMSVIQAFSMPAQQAILNRTSGPAIQQGVTAATAVGFVVQIAGLGFASQLDRFGVATILVCQGAILAVTAYSVTFIRGGDGGTAPSSTGAIAQISAGLQAVKADQVILKTLLINFISTIFNAGSFMTVFPFIVKRVYDGDAVMLASLMAVFFFGAACSNLVLLRFQPLLHPGRIFLIMQLSRIIVLLILYIGGNWWMLALATVLWGLNMGVTSNLARSIVQESAQPEFRGRILSVFSVGLMGSAPIGAVVLGALIEGVGTLNALIPAMMLSAILFAYGYLDRSLWQYRSQIN